MPLLSLGDVGLAFPGVPNCSLCDKQQRPFAASSSLCTQFTKPYLAGSPVQPCLSLCSRYAPVLIIGHTLHKLLAIDTLLPLSGHSAPFIFFFFFFIRSHASFSSDLTSLRKQSQSPQGWTRCPSHILLPTPAYPCDSTCHSGVLAHWLLLLFGC